MSKTSTEEKGPPERRPPRKLLGDYLNDTVPFTCSEAAEQKAEHAKYFHGQKCGGGFRVLRKSPRQD